MYRLYLEKYPDGEFKELATTLLKEISASKTPPVPVVPPAPEPTPLPKIESPTDTNKLPVIPPTPELPTNSSNSQPEPETLYVNTQQMILRAGAGKDYSELGKVSQGVSVVATESAVSADGGNWVKVKTGNLEGWLNRKYLSEDLQNQESLKNKECDDVCLSDIITKTQTGLVMKTSSGTFEIKFYYDSQKDILKFDDRTNNPVVINSNNDISVVEFEDAATSGVFEYSFFEDTGYEMERKQFNPKSGYFTVELPYYSIAKTLKVKKTREDTYFLSKDIGDLMSCNNNKICEVEYKENFSTCLPDCASSNTKFSQKTKQLLMENNWVIRDAKTGDIVLDKRNYRE